MQIKTGKIPKYGPDVEKLELMRAGTEADAVQPEIYQFARKLVRSLPSDAYQARADRIHEFVRDCIKYEHDPNRQERLETSEEIMREGAGDCDGKARFAAALARGLGYDAIVYPVWTVGRNGMVRRLSHVQWAIKFPMSERAGRPYTTPGGYQVGDVTIAGAGLGQDPHKVARNPETGRLPLQ